MSSLDNLNQSGYREQHLLVYIVFALVVMMNLSRATPFYNGDLVGYVAVVQSFYGETPQEIHAATYAQLERETPPGPFRRLTGEKPENSVASALAQNSDLLDRLLPGYFVKPLYPFLMFAFDYSGYDAVKASILLSKTGYLGIAIVLLIWLSRIVPVTQAATIASLIITLPVSLNLARFSSPDALSIFLYLLIAYVVTEKSYSVGALVISMFSIAVRPDNVIFFTLLSLWLLAQNRERRVAIAVTAASGITAYFALSIWSESWGWATTFYLSFIDTSALASISPAGVSISAMDYLTVWQRQFAEAVHNMDYVFLFLILSAGLIWNRRDYIKTWDKYSILITLNLGNILAHLLLFPREMNRFLAGMYIVTIVTLVKTSVEASPVRRQPD